MRSQNFSALPNRTEHATLHVLSHEFVDACFLLLLCSIRGKTELLGSYHIINSKSHLKWEPCKKTHQRKNTG